jgi:hypothetical protein
MPSVVRDEFREDGFVVEVVLDGGECPHTQLSSFITRYCVSNADRFVTEGRVEATLLVALRMCTSMDELAGKVRISKGVTASRKETTTLVH